MKTIAQQVEALHALTNLIQDADTMHVGFVVKMNYRSVVVLTNDKWKQQCGGVPQNAFLVATAFDPANFTKSDPADRIVVLLRAQDEATLPQDSDTLKAIIEHYQRKTEIQAPDRLDGIEKITHARLQFKGLECRILGSFYTDNTGKIYLGSDIENFYSVARLRVYKPTAKALETIVNFIDPLKETKARQDAIALLGSYPEPIPIGNVRYTSTNPNQIAQNSNAPVRIQPMDFLARRTGVFGMTRTGKSNTVKTTVASVATVAKRANVKVGQIVFDIKGEYANANGKDDGSSLAEALGEDVVRYRGAQKAGFRDLRDNMYKSLTTGLVTVQTLLRADKQNSGSDMGALLGLSLAEPHLDDFDGDRGLHQSALSRRRKKVAIYKCLLTKAGLPFAQDDNRVEFEIGKDVYDQLHADLGCSLGCSNRDKRVEHAKQEFGDPSTGMTLEGATGLFVRIRNINRQTPLRGSTPNSTWLDETEKGLLNLLYGKSDTDGWIRSARVIGDAVRQWHSPTGSDNVERDIYALLKQGRVVIVDLSVGTEETRAGRSEAIAEYIRVKGLLSMADEKEPPIIMMYVEEAHNLIGKEAEIASTWPRIAKEGAAINIGLLYCTQEPSSVQPNILANTENFFVTHLNNDREVRAISEYYDFADFKDLIKNAQDVGFSRIKTLSANFVIPTQILRFSPAVVKAEYDAAATPTLAPPTGR
jgi:DNA helicase HerA-like ATPase